LYGDKFEVTSDPVVISDQLVVVDTIEQKSGRPRRVRIPLSVINVADQEKRTA
jgi:hypothetical protein